MASVHWLDSCAAPATAGVGGKGASLVHLQEGGFPVPDGFVVGADGYRLWVAHNELQGHVDALMDVPDLRLPKVARAASLPLQSAMKAATLPLDLEVDVCAAYAQLRERRGPGVILAVRSSALSEDGGASSSAGLYETYLNVRDEDALLAGLQDCYRSLWAFRAVQYRAFKNIDSRNEAMGVVVMEMVPARTSGVAFTVNPVTGSTKEIMINASWGLGEAIVSGRVTPDSFVVRKEDLTILNREIHDKEIMIVPRSSGESGTVSYEVPPDRSSVPSLSDGGVVDLARMCLRIEEYCGGPQDVEWAVADDTLYVLQSRPVTALR